MVVRPARLRLCARTSSFFSVVSGGRYAKIEGFVLIVTLTLGMARSALTPMRAVGWKDSDRKKDRGYQYLKGVRGARRSGSLP